MAKYALVTGGSRGIGFAIAKQLSKDGYTVAICSRHKEGVQTALEAIGNGAQWLHCDVQSQEEINNVISFISLNWGKLDILVNNAGGGGRWGEGKKPHEFYEWAQVWQKNAGSTLQFTMGCLPLMKAGGRVITITSIHSTQSGCKPWFGMAKAAQRKLMQDLAACGEYPNITFNSIAPGYVNVEGKPIVEGGLTPEDIAHAVCNEYDNGTEIKIEC